ncbi:MAG TPA: metal ABC transporter substrate-binding protein [Candidatus Limnocylindrales bacterium]
MRLGRIASALIGVVLVIAGCADASDAARSSGPEGSAGALRVVVSTTVLADMVRNVGGALVEVTSLVRKGADVHTFEPKPADIRAIARAEVLVMNGLGLDDWLEKTVTNAAAPGTPLVKLGVDLPGVTLLPGEEPGTENPHLWMDVTYAERYVDRIAEALKAVDPSGAAEFDRLAADYTKRLAALDASVRAKIGTIPPTDRKVVTFHDALPYYARAYGIEIVGVALKAPGQDPSAAYTAELITTIRTAGVKAIFSEAQFPTRLVDQLAAETGTNVVANLYDDTLSESVPSYEAVIAWDTDQLVKALT